MLLVFLITVKRFCVVDTFFLTILVEEKLPNENATNSNCRLSKEKLPLNILSVFEYRNNLKYWDR